MVKFNLKFLELTKSNRLEMVNWLFLHETTFSGDSASIFKPDGNTIYFVHHYFDKDGKMLEADIYVAYRK